MPKGMGYMGYKTCTKVKYWGGPSLKTSPKGASKGKAKTGSKVKY
jgi:hypothetical protein